VVLVLAVPAAFALAQPGHVLVRRSTAVALAVGLFQPTAVLIIPLYWLVQSLGLLDNPAGLVLPQVARVLPLAVLLLWAGLRNLPADVLEAAATDGAAPHDALRHVALPLMRPLLAVAGLWGFLVSWNDYLVPSVVLQDGTMQTIPLTLAHFVGRVDTQYGLLATGSLLGVAPLLALYALVYGLLARGVQALRLPTAR
jgi:ABC-type glycerol-3-phosphate transport system permease component